MNEENLKLCKKLIPRNYVQQGADSRKTLENKFHQLLEQVDILMTQKIRCSVKMCQSLNGCMLTYYCEKYVVGLHITLPFLIDQLLFILDLLSLFGQYLVKARINTVNQSINYFSNITSTRYIWLLVNERMLVPRLYN